MSTTKLPQMPTYLQPKPMPEDPTTYEYISESDGIELTVRELKVLNQHGYVYESELTDVDYECEDEYGNLQAGLQNIYYFTRIKL